MLPDPHRRAFRSAFTLFEICIAIFIGVMILLAAVPSLTGVIEMQRARKLFNQFDSLAKNTSSRAVIERRPFALVWDDNGVSLQPLGQKGGSIPAEDTGRVDFGKKLAPDLILPASLEKDPPRVWTFWPTGTCEPAKVICHITDSPWTATYDPLSEQAVFTSP